MRVFLAYLVAGVALAVALGLHNTTNESYRGTCVGPEGTVFVDCLKQRRAAWVDPIAIVIAFAGIGAGAALIVSDRRRK